MHLWSLAVLLAAANPPPPHWFAPVPHDQLASWEISPHEAKPGEVIVSKRNELGILSNFAATAFELDGARYASVEGLWQSMLYPEGEGDERLALGRWPHTRGEVAAMAAFDAKRAGDGAWKLLKQKGIRWVTYQGKRLDYTGRDQQAHLDVIRRAMRAKLEQNRRVREALLSTGKLRLR